MQDHKTTEAKLKGPKQQVLFSHTPQFPDLDVFGYLRAGIGTGKQGYHRDHPIDALPPGNISLSCFMSLSGDLTDPVGNAIAWVFGSVRGLPKPWVARTLMLEEGVTPPPCNSHAKVPNPYAYCSLDKGVAITRGGSIVPIPIFCGIYPL